MTIHNSRKLLPRFILFDLKDAYWHVLFHPWFRRFLKFRLKKIPYRYKDMPVGLNIALQIFHQAGSSNSKGPKRTQNINFGVNYCLANLAPRESQCLENSQITIKELYKQGIYHHQRKVSTHSQPMLLMAWDKRGHSSRHIIPSKVCTEQCAKHPLKRFLSY